MKEKSKIQNIIQLVFKKLGVDYLTVIKEIGNLKKI